ncbi:MAG: MoaD/ThiS family protein [Gemmataceae bacterium]
MPRVWIPPLVRDLTGGVEIVNVPGSRVREVLEALEARFPGVQARLCEGDALRPGLVIVVDTEVARLGLRQPVSDTSEIHFVPAIGGGASE